MDPMERALLGIGGDEGGLLAILSHPVAGVLAWVVPVAIEIGLVWLAFRAYRRRRDRIAAAAWSESGDASRRR